ncbi:MAG: class I tRNA ligase family protein, partial [bacterium]|nr:class I tRNA ligase family protein [bacterium]
VQFAGKDQVRQQAAMWQAMLKASGIETPSKQIVIHGFITTGGEKMSKSLGNVIDPVAIVKEYGTDALRYYLARHINPFEDSDFTMEKFKEAYNANLANGLGNLVSRTLTMAGKNGVRLSEKREALDSGYLEALEKFEINKAVDIVWEKIAEADARIQEAEPFKKIKTNPDEARRDIAELLSRLYEIALHLKPILPKTSEIILDLVSSSKVPITPIFPRKD